MQPYVENVPEPPDCPYELLSKVGSGGWADVYRAIHPERPFEPVAVKVPKPGPVAKERFRREIDAMRRLDHVHLMPLIEASPKDEWYAMPLADTTLRHFHAANPADWDGLREALSSACGALMHAHAHGIIHRDVSPDNLLAVKGPHWLLSDFGLVRVSYTARSITPVGASFGAADFAAPEVQRDPRAATPAADIYSLGAIARWFTGISLNQTGLSLRGRYWSQFIDGTMALNAEDRWSLDGAAYHLANLPVEKVLSPTGFGVLPCLRCGGAIDAAGRCLRCGLLDEG
jgi:serine/threonine protein kinase